MTLSLDQLQDNLVRTGMLDESAFLEGCRAVLARGDQPAVENLLQALTADGTLTPFQSALFREGKGAELVMGNYLLLDRLGEGGMGIVYKALHRRMDRAVAIKVIKKEAAANEEFVGRFQREVRAAARLNHPNIIAAYDADECELGHFLVMEFVDGTDLLAIVKRTGGMEEADVIDAIRQAALGLGYAHSQGVIHRDIKPANLMRDVDGVVKIADMGLARLEDPDRTIDEADALTQAGVIAGTVDYMSPEQATDTSSVDHRSDIYSLGCTMYYLLEGQPVFRESTVVNKIVAHREKPRPSLRERSSVISEELDAIFQKMTAIDPDDRYATMAEVADALAALQDARADAPVWTPAETTAFLVEPSKMQARIIGKQLAEIGLEDVHTFATGTEALEAFAKMPADLMLAGIQLSDMTGVELAQRIRGELRWTGVGLLLLTGTELPETTRKNLRQLAAVGILSKPFDAAQLEKAIGQVMSAERPEPRLAGFDELQVLVVDDSLVWRRRMQEVLRGLGFERFTAVADGTQAVAALGERHFDLVVTDYNMPKMDGNELVAHIRQDSTQRAVPVVMVTTEYDPAKLAAVYELGVSAICNKSFDPELVRNIVMRLFL